MIVRSCLSSLINFAQARATYLRNEGIAPGITFQNLDAHANIHELPLNDCLVFGGFALDEDDKIFEVAAYMGAATYNDTHLLRHYKIMDYLFVNLRPEKKIPIKDPDTGEDIGNLVITNGTTLLPVNRAELRPVQIIQFSGLLLGGPALDP